jgi:tetratricopeptide (TPR) repeat protein
MRKKLLGPDHADVGDSLNALGELAFAENDYTRALSLCREGLAIREANLGAVHPMVAYDLDCVAKSQLALGRPKAAIALLERALTLRGGGRGNPLEIADTRFWLAQALWDAGRDRARAVDLAQRSRDAYAGAGEGKANKLAEVDAWLAKTARQITK